MKLGEEGRGVRGVALEYDSVLIRVSILILMGMEEEEEEQHRYIIFYFF